MILPDVNILINAFRADQAEHDRCRRFLLELGRRDDAFGMSPVVLAGFVRIVTNPRLYAEAESLEAALAFCDRLLAAENLILINPGERHWRISQDLCRKAGACGNLVQDAWFAALAIEGDYEWVSLDRDFALFNGLRWREPPA